MLLYISESSQTMLIIIFMNEKFEREIISNLIAIHEIG